jgi:hypothetical protein
MSYMNSSRRITEQNLRVDGAVNPDWVTGTERLPKVGEEVQCAEGNAQVLRVLGRTGDGSRLLELGLPDRPKHPFYAAASNVRVSPVPKAS